MADTKTDQRNERTRGQELTRQQRDRGGLQRWDRPYGSFASPFDWMDRMTEEMDRVFDRMTRDLGFRRSSPLSRGFFGSSAREGIWSPRVEAFHQGDRFIVRAELPGLKKDDVQVELTDEAITIRGERRSEQQEEREGVYLTEREYGEFYRVVPLPEGVIGESAQARFKDGLLEVTLQAPPAEANRGRRLEIEDASAGNEREKR